MNDRWIIVADGAQARFLALERNADRPPRAARCTAPQLQRHLAEYGLLSGPERVV